MYLHYFGKKAEDEILKHTKSCDIIDQWDESPHMLVQGDNLIVLKALYEKYNLESKVDLVYIDPPFSTKNKFTISEDRANTISSSYKDDIAYSDNLTGSVYLEFLRERLVFIRELMSERASIYLHIDYKEGKVNIQKRVAIYARVSTKEQSVDMQLNDLERYSRQRECEIFKIYQDNLSGTKDTRLGLTQMMNDAKKRRFDIVLVWRFDRFARSTKHLVDGMKYATRLVLG